MPRSKAKGAGVRFRGRLSCVGDLPSVNLTIRVSPTMRDEWRKAAAPESLSEFVRAVPLSSAGGRQTTVRYSRVSVL